MTHAPCARTALFLDGELDPEVTALVAVVQDRDGPRDTGAFGITKGMVVGAVVGELLHTRESTTPDPGYSRPVSRRPLFALVLVAAFVGLAGYGVRAGATFGSMMHPAPLETGHQRLEATSPNASEGIVADRTERATEAAPNDRRSSLRDARGLDLLGVLGLAGTSVAALAVAIRRRRHRRTATSARWLAPSRAPPQLLPS
jgi:hypothetical protein